MEQSIGDGGNTEESVDLCIPQPSISREDGDGFHDYTIASVLEK